MHELNQIFSVLFGLLQRLLISIGVDPNMKSAAADYMIPIVKLRAMDLSQVQNPNIRDIHQLVLEALFSLQETTIPLVDAIARIRTLLLFVAQAMQSKAYLQVPKPVAVPASPASAPAATGSLVPPSPVVSASAPVLASGASQQPGSSGSATAAKPAATLVPVSKPTAAARPLPLTPPIKPVAAITPIAPPSTVVPSIAPPAAISVPAALTPPVTATTTLAVSVVAVASKPEPVEEAPAAEINIFEKDFANGFGRFLALAKRDDTNRFVAMPWLSEVIGRFKSNCAAAQDNCFAAVRQLCTQKLDQDIYTNKPGYRLQNWCIKAKKCTDNKQFANLMAELATIIKDYPDQCEEMRLLLREEFSDLVYKLDLGTNAQLKEAKVHPHILTVIMHLFPHSFDRHIQHLVSAESSNIRLWQQYDAFVTQYLLEMRHETTLADHYQRQDVSKRDAYEAHMFFVLFTRYRTMPAERVAKLFLQHLQPLLDNERIFLAFELIRRFLIEFNTRTFNNPFYVDYNLDATKRLERAAHYQNAVITLLHGLFTHRYNNIDHKSAARLIGIAMQQYEQYFTVPDSTIQRPLVDPNKLIALLSLFVEALTDPEARLELSGVLTQEEVAYRCAQVQLAAYYNRSRKEFSQDELVTCLKNLRLSFKQAENCQRFRTDNLLQSAVDHFINTATSLKDISINPPLVADYAFEISLVLAFFHTRMLYSSCVSKVYGNTHNTQQGTFFQHYLPKMRELFFVMTEFTKDDDMRISFARSFFAEPLHMHLLAMSANRTYTTSERTIRIDFYETALTLAEKYPEQLAKELNQIRNSLARCYLNYAATAENERSARDYYDRAIIVLIYSRNDFYRESCTDEFYRVFSRPEWKREIDAAAIPREREITIEHAYVACLLEEIEANDDSRSLVCLSTQPAAEGAEEAELRLAAHDVERDACMPVVRTTVQQFSEDVEKLVQLWSGEISLQTFAAMKTLLNRFAVEYGSVMRSLHLTTRFPFEIEASKNQAIRDQLIGLVSLMAKVNVNDMQQILLQIKTNLHVLHRYQAATLGCMHFLALGGNEELIVPELARLKKRFATKKASTPDEKMRFASALPAIGTLLQDSNCMRRLVALVPQHFTELAARLDARNNEHLCSRTVYPAYLSLLLNVYPQCLVSHVNYLIERQEKNLVVWATYKKAMQAYLIEPLHETGLAEFNRQGVGTHQYDTERFKAFLTRYLLMPTEQVTKKLIEDLQELLQQEKVWTVFELVQRFLTLFHEKHKSDSNGSMYGVPHQNMVLSLLYAIFNYPYKTVTEQTKGLLVGRAMRLYNECFAVPESGLPRAEFDYEKLISVLLKFESMLESPVARETAGQSIATKEITNRCLLHMFITYLATRPLVVKFGYLDRAVELLRSDIYLGLGYPSQRTILTALDRFITNNVNAMQMICEDVMLLVQARKPNDAMNFLAYVIGQAYESSDIARTRSDFPVYLQHVLFHHYLPSCQQTIDAIAAAENERDKISIVRAFFEQPKHITLLGACYANISNDNDRQRLIKFYESLLALANQYPRELVERIKQINFTLAKLYCLCAIATKTSKEAKDYLDKVIIALIYSGDVVSKYEIRQLLVKLCARADMKPYVQDQKISRGQDDYDDETAYVNCLLEEISVDEASRSVLPVTASSFCADLAKLTILWVGKKDAAAITEMYDLVTRFARDYASVMRMRHLIHELPFELVGQQAYGVAQNLAQIETQLINIDPGNREQVLLQLKTNLYLLHNYQAAIFGCIQYIVLGGALSDIETQLNREFVSKRLGKLLEKNHFAEALVRFSALLPRPEEAETLRRIINTHFPRLEQQLDLSANEILGTKDHYPALLDVLFTLYPYRLEGHIGNLVREKPLVSEKRQAISRLRERYLLDMRTERSLTEVYNYNNRELTFSAKDITILKAFTLVYKKLPVQQALELMVKDLSVLLSHHRAYAAYEFIRQILLSMNPNVSSWQPVDHSSQEMRDYRLVCRTLLCAYFTHQFKEEAAVAVPTSAQASALVPPTSATVSLPVRSDSTQLGVLSAAARQSRMQLVARTLRDHSDSLLPPRSAEARENFDSAQYETLEMLYKQLGAELSNARQFADDKFEMDYRLAVLKWFLYFNVRNTGKTFAQLAESFCFFFICFEDKKYKRRFDEDETLSNMLKEYNSTKSEAIDLLMDDCLELVKQGMCQAGLLLLETIMQVFENDLKNRKNGKDAQGRVFNDYVLNHYLPALVKIFAELKNGRFESVNVAIIIEFIESYKHSHWLRTCYYSGATDAQRATLVVLYETLYALCEPSRAEQKPAALHTSAAQNTDRLSDAQNIARQKLSSLYLRCAIAAASEADANAFYKKAVIAAIYCSGNESYEFEHGLIDLMKRSEWQAKMLSANLKVEHHDQDKSRAYVKCLWQEMRAGIIPRFVLPIDSNAFCEDLASLTRLWQHKNTNDALAQLKILLERFATKHAAIMRVYHLTGEFPFTLEAEQESTAKANLNKIKMQLETIEANEPVHVLLQVQLNLYLFHDYENALIGCIRYLALGGDSRNIQDMYRRLNVDFVQKRPNCMEYQNQLYRMTTANFGIPNAKNFQEVVTAAKKYIEELKRRYQTNKQQYEKATATELNMFWMSHFNVANGSPKVQGEWQLWDYLCLVSDFRYQFNFEEDQIDALRTLLSELAQWQNPPKHLQKKQESSTASFVGDTLFRAYRAAVDSLPPALAPLGAAQPATTRRLPVPVAFTSGLGKAKPAAAASASNVEAQLPEEQKRADDKLTYEHDDEEVINPFSNQRKDKDKDGGPDDKRAIRAFSTPPGGM